MKSLQGTPWDRLAGRPAGRPRKTAPQAPLVPTPPMAEETERPSEDDVITVLRAADTENEPSSLSSRPMETEDGGARDNAASSSSSSEQSDGTNRQE